MNLNWTVGGLFALLLTGCGGKNTSSNVESPGDEKTAKTEVLETGADVIQNKAPLQAISMYLDGFHFYNGDMKGQMEAHHYCTQVNEDVIQCMIFDGNGKDAKIMGVEYIVSERLFKTLPAEEKKLWHSHVHEVKSGTLIAPGLPQVAEHELMEKLVSTYGKTYHTWHTDRDLKLPLGHPLIMMGFTKDGQLADSLVAQRDQRFNISTAKKRQNRADIPAPAVQPGANAWEQGEVRQLKVSDDKQPIPGHSH
ncbi:OBAP family protein [Larkinella insperata]|uniref:OBAP family protein n=1 Tax=Larkinella insperata TaxID=332158 RepID=A0ABW3PZC4_9BACT|nr:OBAP family protein [Larkinella insperata]